MEQNIDRYTGLITERDKNMTCCVTGHRSAGFPFPRNEGDIRYIIYKNELHATVEELIKMGFDRFITGGCEGADLDFAKVVILMRDCVYREDSVITLEAALPCPYISPKKFTPLQEYREDILHSCDKTTVISDHYHRGCMHLRNRHMVEKSDLVLAVWNGRKKGGTWNTIQYAKKLNKKIKYIMLTDFEDTSTALSRVNYDFI